MTHAPDTLCDVSDIWGEVPDGPMPPQTAPAVEQNDTTGLPASVPVVRSFDVCCFNSAKDNVPTPLSLTITELRDWLKGHADRAVVDVVATGDKDRDKAVKNAGPAFSLCRYKPGTTRGNANVDVVSGLVLDLDDVDDDDMADVFQRLEGLAFFAWTTWGSGWAKRPQAWRGVVLFAVDVPAEDWPGVWSLLSERFAPMNDRATKDASRMSFLPRVPRIVPDGNGGQLANDPVRWHERDGVVFDPTPIVVEARQRAAAARADAEAARTPEARQTTLQASSRSSANRPDKVTRAEAWTRNAEIAIDGQGGSAVTMRVVGSVVRGFDLDEHEAMQALATWNGNCLGPWSAEELRHKVRDALSTPDPQGRPTGWKLLEDRPVSEARNDDVEVDDVTRAWRQKMAKARADIEAAMGTSAAVLDTPCNFVSYGVLIRRTTSTLSWLVQGVVTDRAVAVIAGEPKTAKTWLAIEMATAVALGDTFIGKFTTGEPRPAVLFLTEDHEANVRDRLRGTVRGHAVNDDVEPPIHVVTKATLNLGDIATLAWLVASVRDLPEPPALLVIDPLRNVMGDLKENDNDDMAKVNAALRALRDVLQTTVLYVHHTSKTTEGNSGRRSGQRMRGASALHGGYDAGIHMHSPSTEKQADITVMTAAVDVEVKAGRSAAPFKVELRIHDDDNHHCVRADWTTPDHAQLGADTDARDEAAVLAFFADHPPGYELSKGALVDQVGGNKDRIGKAVDRLASVGRVVVRNGPRNAKLVSFPATNDVESVDLPQLPPPLGNGGAEQVGSCSPATSGEVGGAERHEDDEARILAAFALTAAPVAMAIRQLVSMSRLPKGRAEAATDRLVAQDRLHMRADKSVVVFKLPGTAAPHSHSKLLQNAWWHSGSELRDGVPYISRDAFRAFLLQSQGVAASKVDAQLNPDGKTGSPVRDMLDAFAIAPHEQGWIVTDAAEAAALVKQKALLAADGDDDAMTKQATA